ncbi:spore cortex biosynthesis protein YabQ [Aciduricibacillus chroicocephali]|uniref:Spore cortex biosynthesis protein YabQ n=1 Tax=Aciduricibacillus chroicocephali TaxID=3054939 RepID=A0ABY9KVJ1_9BACI|nr:spore cortex biosynthesis protein YabQ [Bacillaceae bacterium 44XB]
MTSLNVQFATMITMIGGGFYLGMALDTFRRLTINLRRPIWLLYTTEIGFWLLQTAILFIMLFTANKGEIRFYIFFAGLLGFAAYQVLGRKWYRQLLEILIRIFMAIVRFIANAVRILIVIPIKGLFAIIVAVLLFLIQAIVTVIRFLLIVIFLPIKWLFAILWRLMPKRARNFVHKWCKVYSTMKESCSKFLKWIKFRRR